MPSLLRVSTSTASLGPAYRSATLDALDGGEFDVVIIGGGITGVGCALDAASRGLTVALIEQRDISSGTSSRSSKPVSYTHLTLPTKESRCRSRWSPDD